MSPQQGLRGIPGVGFNLTDDGNYNIDGKRLTNVGEPTGDGDATTKAYFASENSKKADKTYVDSEISKVKVHSSPNYHLQQSFTFYKDYGDKAELTKSNISITNHTNHLDLLEISRQGVHDGFAYSNVKLTNNINPGTYSILFEIFGFNGNNIVTDGDSDRLLFFNVEGDPIISDFSHDWFSNYAKAYIIFNNSKRDVGITLQFRYYGSSNSNFKFLFFSRCVKGVQKISFDHTLFDVPDVQDNHMILYFENLNLNGNLINGLGDPIHQDSATNKKYVDTENIRQNIAINDRASKSYVDAEIAKVHIDTTPLLPRDGSRSMTSDLDMDNNHILSVKNLNDYKVDDAYEVRVRDLKSVVNKEYLNEKFLKVDKNGNYFDLKQNTIKNCEPYYDGLFDDNSLVSKAFVDAEIAKQPKNVLLSDGSKAMTGNLDMGGNAIKNIKPFVEDDSSQAAQNAQLNDVFNFGYFHAQRGELKREINDVSFEALNRKNPDPMEDNIDMNNHRIKGLSDGNENDDAVNIKQLNEAEDNLSKYINDKIKDNNTKINSIIDQKIKDSETSSIDLIDQENVFKIVMDDDLFKEDDDDIHKIGVKNKDFHLVNKKTYEFKIDYDSSIGYYSTRLSIDLIYLDAGNYTMVFEMYVEDGITIDQIEGTSGTLSGITTKSNIDGTNTRSIIHFNYNGLASGFNDLDIDIKLKSKTNPQTTIYVVVYGVNGNVNNISVDLWDRFYYYDNDSVNYEVPIDMKGKDITGVNKIVTNNLDVNGQTDIKGNKIVNLRDGSADNDAVNKSQLNKVEKKFIILNDTVANNNINITTINTNNSYYYFATQLNHNNWNTVLFPNINNSYPYSNGKNIVTGSKTYSVLRILLSGNYHIIYTDFYKNSDNFVIHDVTNGIDLFNYKVFQSSQWKQITINAVIPINVDNGFNPADIQFIMRTPNNAVLHGSDKSTFFIKYLGS